MHTGSTLRNRHGISHPQSEPPLWNHPPLIQVATLNRHIEREMVVAGALALVCLWSSSWWLVLNVEPVAVEPPTLDPDRSIEPKRRWDSSVSSTKDESQWAVKP
jgi:hypothetical protein